MLKPYSKAGRIEAGCDEAGRGCLAGPVFAAAVILHPDRPISGLNDSKKLNERTRDRLRSEIEQKALAWAVAHCDEQEIDRINILKASILSMRKAITALHTMPQHILVDGNKFDPMPGYSFETVIKGDGIYASIAAASILAKTHRDQWMRSLHKHYPQYGFDRHKGYGTAAHVQAILAHGFSPVHRKSFHVKRLQISLFP